MAGLLDCRVMRLVLSLLLAVACATAQQSGSRARDETAIREIVDRYVAARDQTNATATAALFTADADQLVSSGEWRRGRDELVRGAMASSQASSGKRTITIETIRFITGDVALADGRYEIAASGSAPARKMWTSLLMRRTGEGWRIAAIRNMLPAK